MVAVRGEAAIDAYLKRPDPAHPIILLYGPDTGLVSERANALIASALDDPTDPFALIHLEGDDLFAEPSRLADEALTIPLFGGRRAIRVRAGSRSFVGSIEALASAPIKDCRIVIEAGDLKPESALRKTCERAKNAVAIPCFVDNEHALSQLIDEEMRAAGLRVLPDARAALLGSLGGDRQASRNELRKLALYAHGNSDVTLQDVMAIVTDVAGLRIDPILDSAFAGDTATFENVYARAMQARTDPGLILMMAQRHAASLHRASILAANGQTVTQAVEKTFFRLHFTRKERIEAALRLFSPARLGAAIEQLGIAAFDARRATALDGEIAQRALMAIAANARRRN